eukprot:g29121.t1
MRSLDRIDWETLFPLVQGSRTRGTGLMRLTEGPEQLVKYTFQFVKSGILDGEESYLKVHQDLDQLVQWAEELQMAFNAGLECLSYKERLDRLGLFSLDHRRLRYGLVEVYKIMKGMDRVNSQGFFPRVAVSKTRRRRFKVRGERFKRDLRGNLFAQRVVRLRKELPEEVVEA